MRLYGDPVLRRKAKPLAATDLLTVPGFQPQTVREVADAMLETMFEQRGVGLAAPQIGLPVRLFVAVEYADDEEEHEGQDKPLRSRVLREYVMLNPVIRPLNKKKDRSYQEGCLSIPGIYEEGVARARQVRIDYTDLEGQPRSLEAEDYLARVFQHELDHLDGVLFLDRLPDDVTSDHRAELLKIQQAAKTYLTELTAWEKRTH
ncbi:peptide deformylase [Deinococcus reticulitermitis]|uniref:Peptide deformylase n=2 Tax=Deinococcus reticulitermitis TaxID=856736 RepID=A0A1H7A0W0_9DEIO|nr:peptide deformylase [Deinococcus reticulitermitis]